MPGREPQKTIESPVLIHAMTAKAGDAARQSQSAAAPQRIGLPFPNVMGVVIFGLPVNPWLLQGRN